jgi:hypothetical protein
MISIIVYSPDSALMITNFLIEVGQDSKEKEDPAVYHHAPGFKGGKVTRRLLKRRGRNRILRQMEISLVTTSPAGNH